MGVTGVGALLGALTLAVRTGVRGLGRLIAHLLRRVWRQPDRVFVFASCSGCRASLLVPVGFFIMLQMACSNT